jgi:DNA-binding NtrC family response regulator
MVSRGDGGYSRMKRMILIVDDEERVLFVLQNTLKKLENNFEVVTASTAAEGLRKARDEEFDLVITDLIMPDMDGIEFTEKIRDLNCEAAVVWMTAYGCQRFEREAERLGVYCCVEKPVEIQEFREVARRAIATDEEGGRDRAGGGIRSAS